MHRLKRKIVTLKYDKDSKYVQAVKDYVVTSNDASLLSFRKNDIIKLTAANDPSAYVPNGWLRGATPDNRREGLFPIEYVRPVSRVGRVASLCSVTPPLISITAAATTTVTTTTAPVVTTTTATTSSGDAVAKVNECFGSIDEQPVRLRPSDVATAQPAAFKLSHTSPFDPHSAYLGNELDAAPLQRSPQQEGHYSMMEFAMMHFKQSIDK